MEKEGTILTLAYEPDTGKYYLRNSSQTVDIERDNMFEMKKVLDTYKAKAFDGRKASAMLTDLSYYPDCKIKVEIKK